MRWPFLFMGAMFYGNAFNWFSVDQIERGIICVSAGSFCVWASDYWRDKPMATARKGRMSE